MKHVENGTEQVGKQDPDKATFVKSAGVKRQFQRILPEQGERRDKEKDRHAESAGDFQQCEQMHIGLGVGQQFGAGMDADNAQHRQAADIFNRMDSLIHRYLPGEKV